KRIEVSHPEIKHPAFVLRDHPFSICGHGRKDKSWMLNLRVADLDAFAAQLEAEGVAVTVDPQDYPNGRFATLADPEGNPIQLWEPALP
ncbi:MAG: VOC family protein, partial [Pseudomonadota bacterium]